MTVDVTVVVDSCGAGLLVVMISTKNSTRSFGKQKIDRAIQSVPCRWELRQAPTATTTRESRQLDL